MTIVFFNADSRQLRSRSSRSGAPLPGLDPGFEWITLSLLSSPLERGSAAPSLLLSSDTGQTAISGLQDSPRAYAKGEISREEYLRIANDLDQHENVPEV